MTDFLTFVMFIAIAGWMVASLVRLCAAWEAHQSKTNDVRKSFTAAGLKLASEIEHIQKLDDEIKRVKDKMATAVLEQQDRYAAFKKSVRPPPPDVYVTSEFPPSTKDLPWIATFMRDPRAAPMLGETEPKPMLIWGHTQNAALHRARQLIQEHKTYSVGDLALLTV